MCLTAKFLHLFSQTMQKNEFFFELPKDLIAQYPAQNRTESKTLILDDKHTILYFKHTLKHFAEYDLVVLNET